MTVQKKNHRFIARYCSEVRIGGTKYGQFPVVFLFLMFKNRRFLAKKELFMFNYRQYKQRTIENK